MFTRRRFLQRVGATLLVTPWVPFIVRSDSDALVSVRALTRGPKYHWFGYYDKWQFDASGRFVLGMEVGFEGRSPCADDLIRVGVIDLEDGDRWTELGTSRAWSWQQGCMLQWLSADEVIWNDREGDRFVSHILNMKTSARRTIPSAIYAICPDGQTAVTTDFNRIQDTRPGYGYPGLPDPHAAVTAPADAGIYRVDLTSGKRALIYSLARAAAVPFRDEDLSQHTNWFNHLLVNPFENRFIFLHRWRPKDSSRYRNVGGFGTRMMTADLNGQNECVVDEHGYTSHFIWRDARHILAWTRLPDRGNGFFLFTDQTQQVEQVGKGIMTENGHCTYLPGNDWILNDTYPDGQRKQTVYLYHVPSQQVKVLGRFLSPSQYTGEWRCDTHPRSSRQGDRVCIDSTHGGEGRQLYLLDL